MVVIDLIIIWILSLFKLQQLSILQLVLMQHCITFVKTNVRWIWRTPETSYLPWFIYPGYTPIGQLDVADGLIRGPVAPKSRAESQVLMMIGLPGAGKTYWAEKFAKENEADSWNILGTNNLIEKMKVQGLNRKRNYGGRWEVLIKKCTDCFNVLLGVAATRRRNFILDQVKRCR